MSNKNRKLKKDEQNKKESTIKLLIELIGAVGTLLIGIANMINAFK